MNAPLADAVVKGDVAMARALLAAGASITTTVVDYDRAWSHLFDYRPAPMLHVATLGGNVELVRLLLEFGADVNERPEIERSYQTHDDSYYEPGDSALDIAIRRARIDLIDLLLSAGARTDADSERELAKLKR